MKRYEYKIIYGQDYEKGFEGMRELESDLVSAGEKGWRVIDSKAKIFNKNGVSCFYYTLERELEPTRDV